MTIANWEIFQIHEIKEKIEKTKVNKFSILYHHSVLIELFS